MPVVPVEVEMWRLAALFIPCTLIFFGLQAGIVVGSRLAFPNLPPDPFEAFEALMPGQLVALSNPSCSSQPIDYYPPSLLCEIRPDSGAFVLVQPNVFEGLFVRTDFVADDLYVGDIIRHWGRPDVVRPYNQDSFYVLWSDQALVGFIDPVKPAEQFHYLVPVHRFTIARHESINSTYYYPK